MCVGACCRGYMQAMKGLRKHLLMRTDHDGLLFVGEIGRHGSGKTPKMDHLVCFLPGISLSHFVHADFKNLAFHVYRAADQPFELKPIRSSD